jgi:hypothetical protein
MRQRVEDIVAATAQAGDVAAATALAEDGAAGRLERETAQRRLDLEMTWWRKEKGSRTGGDWPIAGGGGLGGAVCVGSGEHA